MSDSNDSVSENVQAASSSELIKLTPCTARHYANRTITLLSKIDDLRTACLNYDLGNSELVEEFEESFETAEVAINRISEGLRVLGDRDQASGIREQRKAETMAKRAKMKEERDIARAERTAKREELKAKQIAERDEFKARAAAKKAISGTAVVVDTATPEPVLAADEVHEVPADTHVHDDSENHEVEHRSNKKHKKAANA